MGLFDRAAGELELNAVTGVGDAHDVPGVLALDDVDAFPGGFLEHVGHDVGQRLQVAPADVSALQRVGGARVGGGEHGEVLACAGALGDLLGMLLELFGVVGMVDRDQDVLDVEFRRVARREAGLLGEVGVDFTFGNLDLGVDLAFAQALRRDFVADLLAEGGEGDAVGHQTLTELVDRQVVLTGDLLDGGVDHLVVDADAGFAGALLDGAFEDQAFKHLGAELLHRRELDVLAAQVDGDDVRALLKLAVRDDVVVDDRHDAVEFDVAGLRLDDGSRLRRFGNGLLGGEGGAEGGHAHRQHGNGLELIHSNRTVQSCREHGWWSDNP